MLGEEDARDFLAQADASLSAASRYLGGVEDGDLKNAVQRLFDAVNKQQELLRAHTQDHP
jgi:hypothetical protein